MFQLRTWARRPAVVDLGVALLFLAAAVWVGQGLWPDPTTRELILNPEDQILIEWFFAVDVQVLFGDQGLVTDRLNAPDGMNMLANATSLTLGLLLAPVTLTAGAPVSFAIATIGNLAATAIAWYLLFSRTLGAHRLAAAVAAGFCGFAPAMISHSNSHWHMSSQWLVPAIAWSVIRLTRAAEQRDHRRILTSALWLAGLVIAQYFLGAEVLYLAAVAFALFSIGYAVLRLGWARKILPGFLTGMAVATGLATAALAYPIWVQLAGPVSVADGPFDPYYYSADLASWTNFSPLSIAGSDSAAALATGPAEYNAFLGWPLLLAAVAGVIWLRDNPLVLAAAGASAILAVLSLGPELIMYQTRMQIPLPYVALVDTPVIDGALPQRYAVAVVPLLALILLVGLERARRQTDWQRYAVPVVAAAVLLPLLPTPLPAGDRDPVPQFISEGHWRECVSPGGVLVPVPLPTPPEPEPMRWAAAANAEFGLPEGFFIGPYGAGGTASMGTAKRTTSALLAEVAATGAAPEIGREQRAHAQADLAYWNAECVVLGPGQQHETALRDTLAALLNAPGQRIADAWVWPVAR
ncbi:hypothetical protein JQS43_21755 [Natronosporangium hydrolyticum]|uniref:Glycosyl transferase n=2 Tax=Natronosporangium hydrolyticum TaxID=2811111 RepID=A0A895YNF8_9ACTN|nr:hypothetical protein JQS43_21755 [Natronosporangium hydrolyticum]